MRVSLCMYSYGVSVKTGFERNEPTMNEGVLWNFSAGMRLNLKLFNIFEKLAEIPKGIPP